jgi:hypothetical protein
MSDRRSDEQRLVDDLLAWMNPPDEQHARSNGHASAATVSDEEIIDRCRSGAGRSAGDFRALFDDGDTARYDEDSSRADFALIGILKRRTRNADQIERIMLRSALRRPKWDENRVGLSWLRYSINNALDEPDPSFSSFSPPIGGTSDDENKSSPIQWFAELGEPKEREFLIEHVGQKGYPVVAYGAGGVAKSFAVLAAGIAIASSSGVDEWLGLRVLDHGHVLYADFELDVDEQHRRVRDLCAGMGVPIPKRLAYLSGVGISTDRAFQEAYDFAAEYEPKAIIIDSTGMAMVGDMDRAKDVTAFYKRYVEPFRRMDVTQFLVDHEGKLQAGEKHKDKSPIGSVYKTNNSRSVLQFILDEYDEENSALDIRLRQHKTNFTPIKPFGVRITFEAQKVSIETRDLPAEEMIDEERAPVADRIVAALRIEAQTVADLEKHTGAAAGTIYNKLSQLVSAGKVREDGYRGRKKLYCLFSSSSEPPIGSESNENENDPDADEGMLF